MVDSVESPFFFFFNKAVLRGPLRASSSQGGKD